MIHLTKIYVIIRYLLAPAGAGTYTLVSVQMPRAVQNSLHARTNEEEHACKPMLRTCVHYCNVHPQVLACVRMNNGTMHACMMLVSRQTLCSRTCQVCFRLHLRPTGRRKQVSECNVQAVGSSKQPGLQQVCLHLLRIVSLSLCASILNESHCSFGDGWRRTDIPFCDITVELTDS